MALNEGQLGPVPRHARQPVDYLIDADTYPLYEFSSEYRLPATMPWNPLTPINALRIMNLTDPNGHPVTFMPGEALPGWAQQYR